MTDTPFRQCADLPRWFSLDDRSDSRRLWNDLAMEDCRSEGEASCWQGKEARFPSSNNVGGSPSIHVHFRFPRFGLRHLPHCLARRRTVCCHGPCLSSRRFGRIIDFRSRSQFQFDFCCNFMVSFSPTLSWRVTEIVVL